MTNNAVWLLLDARGFGGIERHVEVLASELRRRGIPSEIIFWDSFPQPSWIERLTADGQPFRTLDGKLRTLVSAIRSSKPVLIHTHGYKANIMGRAAAALTGTPCVASFHAGLREHLPVGLYQRLDEATSLFGGRIAVSEAIRASLPFPSTLIENFIASPPPPEPAPLPRAAAFIGRLTHEKGIDLFCKIAESVGPAIEWHVYGDGPLRKELEETHGKLVRFHGFASDMSSVWPHVGLVVMPSRAEGLPMTAIEALSNGVPVAASRVGGLPKAVQPGTSGWLFEAGDIDGAKAAIEEWMRLEPQEQSALRLRCWTRAATHYSAETGVARLLDVYAAYAPELRNAPLSSASSHP